MQPHNLPLAQDVTMIEMGKHQISVVKVTPENTDYLVQVSISMYLDEACKYCGKVYKTLDDLMGTVFADYHANGRLACKSCWDINNPAKD